MKNCTSVAAPLHTLPLPRINLQAKEAFQSLKQGFFSAPILTLSDPKFIFGVDVCDLGVGANLFQCCPNDNKVHPCAFFPGSYPLLDGIMMWATGSFWL